MNTVRYGMVGCGMMGQEHLRNLALLAGTRVTAIFEPDAEMLQRSLALAPHASSVPSLESLLERDDIDALVITSPNHCHADQLLAIAAQRTLPILSEKPICTNLADVQRLRELVRGYSQPLWTAMEYRYMPPIARLVALSHSEETTGALTMLSIREHRYPFLTKVGNWNRLSRNTGGTLVEKCCHFFDLMRLVMQADPIRIFASGAMNHNHADESYDGEVPDILDNAFVVLNFPDNRRAMLDLCMFAEGSRYQEEISVVGPNGKLEVKVPGPARFWPSALGPQPVSQLLSSPRHDGKPTVEDIPVDEALLAAGDHNGSTFYQHQKFLRAIRNEGPVEVNLMDGLKAVVIGLAAEHSAKTGDAIDLTQGPWSLHF